ncbi:hypothetical protein QUF88_14415 [Bacillus sp. DX1.1]|uniref:hypothetical protein n=1 Tax=unclassified Bacillus (in: firmicutes) TaxID=185979 RepID=UPI0025712BD2|nr:MULTISPECIES: hypothetical protein [unclassified Bacillus (in: firmicutes)]MDM5154969.1 hypothetical protein [Bacillus sp. DX1.1]WJE83833.1 hypothetical protein QRE67_11910 [Bacillus sp. DX3.1]
MLQFTIGEILTFEEILIRAVKVNKEFISFEVLSSDYEGDEGDIIDIPLSYLEDNKEWIKR